MEEHLGIAGSGTIACGLAATAARRHVVTLWARSEESANRARAAVSKAISKLGDDAPDPDRVDITTDIGGLGDCSFLVEAVIEHHGHKSAVLSDLGTMVSYAAAGAKIATTTSSLSIAELAEASGHPENFVGLHVFNPVPRMQLIELAFPKEATEDTRQRARDLCESLDKTPIEVPDIPGFVVNRLLFPYLFSAVELMQESGMSAEAIDQCMVLGAGLPMGPLALLDFVGLDVAQAIGDAIGTPVPDLLRTLVFDGTLGRKTGRGFFTY